MAACPAPPAAQVRSGHCAAHLSSRSSAGNRTWSSLVRGDPVSAGWRHCGSLGTVISSNLSIFVSPAGSITTARIASLRAADRATGLSPGPCCAHASPAPRCGVVKPVIKPPGQRGSGAGDGHHYHAAGVSRCGENGGCGLHGQISPLPVLWDAWRAPLQRHTDPRLIRGHLEQAHEIVQDFPAHVDPAVHSDLHDARSQLGDARGACLRIRGNHRGETLPTAMVRAGPVPAAAPAPPEGRRRSLSRPVTAASTVGEDTGLPTQAGDAQEPGDRGAGAARQETPGSPARRPARISTARPLASRQLTRDRPGTSRPTAGGAIAGIAAGQGRSDAGFATERGDGMGALGPGGRTRAGKDAGVRVHHGASAQMRRAGLRRSR